MARLAYLLFTCTTLALLLVTTWAAKVSDPEGIVFTIEEQCANFTRVGDISQQPAMLRRLQSMGIHPSTCSYAWIQKKHPLASKLLLDERSGLLHTIESIDREEYLTCGTGSVFCCTPAAVICSIPMSLGVQCGSHPMIIMNVRLELTDKNDHVPQFPASNFTIEIPESAEVGSKYYFPAASDPDSNPNSIDGHTLLLRLNNRLLSQDLFDVKLASTRVQLTLKKRLDRELNERYDFEVRANDRPGRTGTANLTVLVSDVNDHPPVFTAPNKLYNVTVPEDVRIGETIIQLHATDNDVGENAHVMYEFHETVSQYVRDKFLLDEDSGNLTLRSSLDYESISRIEFLVVAKNRAPLPSRSDEASVVITVQNVNDESPVIEVEYRNELVDDRTSGEISENLAHTFVAFVFVSDSDPFGGVNCSLSNDRFRLESFYRQPTSTDFRLNVTRPFDRETSALETVTISCSDRGVPPRSSSQLIRIHVKDANDQPPTFTESPIRCNVSENNHVGMPICQISQFVRDSDEGENSLIKYTLEKSARSAFRIEEFSGQLSAVTSFDRENRSSFQFLVVATDQGKPALSATGTVVVTITDANDNAPRFSYPLKTHFSVREQRPFDEYVGTVRAMDPDAENNARIVYSLESAASPFRITESGEIFTTQELDRESEDTYQLVVVATDSGSPPQSASTTVSITVNGVNDCHPSITFPTSSNNTVRISYLEPPNRLVATIAATDRDAPESHLTYSIIEGNEHGLFFIDPASGAVHIAKSLADALGEHILLVRVEDGGTPVLHSDARLRIVVDNSAPAYDYSNSHSQATNNGYAVSTMHLVVIAALACAIMLVLLAACAIVIRRRLVLRHSLFSPASHQKRKGKQNSHCCSQSQSHKDDGKKLSSAPLSRNSQSKSRDRKDANNQEDLEVQAAFLQLNDPRDGANDDAQIYATVDSDSGAYEHGVYDGPQDPCDGHKGELQPLHTVSEHVCAHGGPLVPFAPSGPLAVLPVESGAYFRSLVPPLDSHTYSARVHAHAGSQNLYAPAVYGELHARTCSQPRFASIPNATARLYQDGKGQLCLQARPHTAALHAQSDSFSSVAAAAATPEPQICSAADWNASQQEPGYFQYDECNNLASTMHLAAQKADRRRKRNLHGQEQYYTIDRLQSDSCASEQDAPQSSRVYGGIVKGSFV